MATIEALFEELAEACGVRMKLDRPAAATLMEAVHVQACEKEGRTARGKGWRRRACGEGWACEQLEAIRLLGAE